MSLGFVLPDSQSSGLGVLPPLKDVLSQVPYWTIRGRERIDGAPCRGRDSCDQQPGPFQRRGDSAVGKHRDSVVRRSRTQIHRLGSLGLNIDRPANELDDLHQAA